ncbi:MAG: trypsin-like peptidase domain-containing protein [Oscillospiraceae bacterium]
MYNPYENNNQPTGEQPTENQGSYGPVYGQPPQSSYTWGAQNPTPPTVYPPVQPPHPPKPPKKHSKTGTRIVALVLCCLLSSAVSVGAFVALIHSGAITIDRSGAAFTITKVADENSNTTAATDEVGVLSRQEISKKLIPSVVCIQNYQVNDRYGFLGNTTTGNSEVSPAGEGSGIVLTADGYIATNAHVVADATSLKVVMSDGSTYEATIIGSDEITDLAVIKVEATGLTPAEFGSSEDLSVADEVIAIGNPGGMTFNSSVTIGYVSALNREISGGEGGYPMNCIQTDAAINPGNSGGALVNKYGQVVGINSAKIVESGYEGLGFAIPSETAQPIISDLKNYGYVKDRAILGISGQYIDEMTAQFYGLTPGMFVAEVSSNHASQAGLQKGDVITMVCR